MYVSSQSPYYDDFNETKKFYRILFRPGRAVQARELTQLQSILQKQIDRFGSHIFKEGSIVIPGSQFYEKNYSYVKLQTTYNSIDADSVIANLEGQILKGLTNSVRAVVVKAVTSEASDPPTLYVKYIDSGSSGTQYTFETNEILEQETDGTPIYVRAATSNPVGLGTAFNIKSGVMFIKGVFAYFGDQTLVVSKYSKQTTDQRIGFLITEEIIDDQDDASLLDPSVGTANYFAPGADRYKLDLTLESRGFVFDNTVDDTNFVELLRIQNNEVVFNKPKVEYNLIADELARRTYDESGDYSINPYKVQLLEHLRSSNVIFDGYLTSSQGGSDDKYVIKVGPGKSYVKGYEIESLTNRYVVGNKARSFANVNSGTISVEVGNYVNVNDIHSSPDVLTLGKIELYNKFVTAKGAKPTNSILVGNARVRSMEYFSGTVANSSTGVYSLYLFDVNMVKGYKFEDDVKSFYYDNAGFEDFTANIAPQRIRLTGGVTTVNGSNVVTGASTLFTSELRPNNYVSIGDQLFQVASISNSISFYATTNANTTIVGSESIFLNKAVINSNDRQSYIFEMPYQYIKTIDPDDTETIYTSRRIVDTNLSSGNITLTARTNETFAPYSTDNYKLLIKQYGRFEDLTGKVSRGGTPTGRTVTFSLYANTNITSDAVRIFATVNKTNSAAIRKNKTLITNQTVEYNDANVAAAAVVSLGKADVIGVRSVKMSTTAFGTSYSDTNATDITSRYSLDSGQRLQYYDVGSIRLNPNQAKPTNPIKITFDYYSHSTSGDYFSADSYTDIGYKFIPIVKLNGKTYNLRDCLDFRPRIGDDSTFSSTSAVINEFVDQETDFQTDYQYYLPKIDKLVLDRKGNLFIVSGVSDLIPKEPSTPEGAMPLFILRQNPYVSNVGSDINLTEIDNRRYTMRDIGRLDNRLKNLEYYTSLNLLEVQTATLQVQDALGFDRFKNGFVVDNFSGHGIGDVSNDDYNISIDYNKRELRPVTETILKNLFEENITDASRTSNNYVRTRDFVLPKYTEELYVSCNVASRSEPINPFDIVTFKGFITLDPSTDIWFDTVELPFMLDNPNGAYDNMSSLAQIRRNAQPYESIYGFWKDVNFGNTRTDLLDASGENTVKTNYTRTTDVTLNSSGSKYDVVETIDTSVSGDRIVSRNIIPKMRNKAINFKATGMKPNTKLYAFFDDIDVTRYTRISYRRANVIANVNNTDVGNVSLFSDIITDQFGKIEGTFVYTADALELPIGSKTFRLTDSVTNSDDKTTFAEALYTAGGQLVFRDKIISTEKPKDEPKNTPASSPSSPASPTGPAIADPVYPPVVEEEEDPPNVLDLASLILTVAGNSSQYYLSEANKLRMSFLLNRENLVLDSQCASLVSSRCFAGQKIAANYILPDGFFWYYLYYSETVTTTSLKDAIAAGGADGIVFQSLQKAIFNFVLENIGSESYLYAFRCTLNAANQGLSFEQMCNVTSPGLVGHQDWHYNPFVKFMYISRTNASFRTADPRFNTVNLDDLISLASEYVSADVAFRVVQTQDSGIVADNIITTTSEYNTRTLTDSSVRTLDTGGVVSSGSAGSSSGPAGAGTQAGNLNQKRVNNIITSYLKNGG